MKLMGTKLKLAVNKVPLSRFSSSYAERVLIWAKLGRLLAVAKIKNSGLVF